MPNVIAAWPGFSSEATNEHPVITAGCYMTQCLFFGDLLLFGDPFYSPTILEIPLLLFGTTPDDGSQRSAPTYTQCQLYYTGNCLSDHLESTFPFTWLSDRLLKNPQSLGPFIIMLATGCGIRSFNPPARLDRSSSAIYVHNAAE